MDDTIWYQSDVQMLGFLWEIKKNLVVDKDRLHM